MNAIILLGLGMQGKAALHDLFYHTDYSPIIVADNSPELDKYLQKYVSDRIIAKQIDARDENQLKALFKGASMIIDALPGPFAFQVAKIAAKVGVNLVSSMYYLNPLVDDQLKIQELKNELQQIDLDAKRNNITILPEFGLDPGIDLVLGAKALSEFDQVEEFYSYGTGVPSIEHANNPLKYKFSWSVSGVLNAYRRPSKIISNGKIVEISGKEIFLPENRHILEMQELDQPLECYPNGNSIYYAELYGLKNSVKEMGRYACRWPGHCDFWYALNNSGFLSHNPVRVGKSSIDPFEFTTTLLSSQKQFWYNDHDEDITIVRVDVRGISKGRRKQVIYQLIDKRDFETGFTAMQRTVGFTMALGARFIVDGKVKEKGLISPIDIPYDLLKNGLKQNNMEITHHEKLINKNK